MTSSIQTSQAIASNEGTSARSSVHSLFGKVRKYGALIILIFFSLYLWRTGDEGKTTAFVKGDGDSKAQTEQEADVQVDLTKEKVGIPVVVRMGVTSTAKVYITHPPVSDGVTAYGICTEVVEPQWIVTHKNSPKKHMEFFNPRVGYIHEMRLTNEMKSFLVNNEVTNVAVSFTLVLTRVGVAAESQCLKKEVPKEEVSLKESISSDFAL